MIPLVKTQTPVNILSSCLGSEMICSTASESLGKTFHTHQISKYIKPTIPSDIKDVGKLIEPQWRQIGHF